jgi:uncharacterized damage-inducible protein DinB
VERRVVSAFTDLLGRLARMTDEKMEEPWTWPGHDDGDRLLVRDAHCRCLELEQVAVVAAPPPATEAAAAMDLAQASWGDLRGLLAGLDDGLLDAEPGEGDWPLRAILVHILAVEVRYSRQIAYAASRSDDDPVYLRQQYEIPPDQQMGGVDAWIERLEAARTASHDALAGLGPAALERPTVWATHTVDVRFRLHRYAGHLVEHTIHAEKVLRALGQPPSEARQIVRRISAMRGAHERRTPPDRLAALNAQEADLAASATISG